MVSPSLSAGLFNFCSIALLYFSPHMRPVANRKKRCLLYTLSQLLEARLLDRCIPNSKKGYQLQEGQTPCENPPAFCSLAQVAGSFGAAAATRCGRHGPKSWEGGRGRVERQARGKAGPGPKVGFAGWRVLGWPCALLLRDEFFLAAMSRLYLLLARNRKAK